MTRILILGVGEQITNLLDPACCKLLFWALLSNSPLNNFKIQRISWRIDCLQLKHFPIIVSEQNKGSITKIHCVTGLSNYTFKYRSTMSWLTRKYTYKKSLVHRISYMCSASRMKIIEAMSIMREH